MKKTSSVLIKKKLDCFTRAFENRLLDPFECGKFPEECPCRQPRFLRIARAITAAAAETKCLRRKALVLP